MHGLCLQEYAGQNLKYGVVVVTAVAHVAANNRHAVVVLARMLVKLLELPLLKYSLFAPVALVAVLKTAKELADFLLMHVMHRLHLML